MKKLLWVMAALFVSFAVAAQTTDSVGRITINSAEEFLRIGVDANYPSNGNYIQTADINLGNMETLDTAIIKLFSGTYDGGRHSISYSATFRGRSHKSENGGYRCNQHGNGSGNYYGDYGLFGFLQGGVIKNLNLSGEILIIPYPGDGCNDMNYALLCGHAFCGSTIDHCNVSGTVNSQVEGEKGGGDAGLLIGQADGATIQYCTGSGNVSSIGWVGGLIGSGGHNSPITIKACTFSGSVQASRAKSNTAKPDELKKGYGGFAGGIIGFAGKHGLNNWQSVEPSVSIDLCYVKADITATNVVSGIASVAMGAGTATVENSCAEGSITKTEQNGETDTTTNSTTHTVQSNTYDSSNKTVDELEQIVEALNGGRADGEKAEFDVVDGQIVLYPDGKPAEPCAAVTGLTISHVAPRSLTCSWTAGGSGTAWNVSISGGGLTEDITRSVTTNQNVQITDENLTASQSNYVLSVVAVCGDDRNSTPTTSSFVISCPTITGMNVTPDYTSATVTWSNTEEVEAKLYQGETLKETQVITSAQLHTCTFNSLTPNTTYKVKLSAKCGGDYVGATERVFTTPSLPIVENVRIAARYEDGGSVAITWDYALDGATYEVEVQTSASSSVDNQTELTTKSYNKSSIDVGSYQARIKATYQGHEAGWTEWFPFVISDPNAPKNVHWSDTAIVNSQYQLTLAWIKGNDVEIQGNSGQGWEITADPNSGAAYTIIANSETSNYSQVLSNDNHYVTPGTSQTFYIREWTQQENNYYYSSWFPITFVAPCFEIAENPTAGAITQTSATLSGLRSGYVVVLSDGTNTTNYPVSGETLSLIDLTPATHYTAEVRSYCNQEQEKYSSKTVEFTTVGCYSPTNVTVTNITPLQAQVSWTQGNPNLSELPFYYILEEKEINGTYTQVETAGEYSETSIIFTNLKPATEYRVSVAEQCGTDYGIPTEITFTTTPGNFVAISTGTWGNAATWQDGRIPNGIGTITINNGVTVTLDRTLVLTENYTLTNNGTLLINNGELVNTTDNNNLGNVRISFTATQNTWKFIGAPFTGSQDSKYRLESIEPVPNSDVAVVLYNYSNGAWSNDWATINNSVPQAEGFFAWPFYNGTITFNNDYNTDNTVDYSLNNSDITVTRDVITSTSSNPNGNWMSLANPYPAKLDIARFLSNNSAAGLQGEVVYIFNGSTFVVTNGTSGSLPVCEGFFVNFSNSGENKSVTFHKTQMTSYPSENNTESKTAQSPWIEMSLVNKRDKVKFFFAHNPLAEQGYDKYDANKLFATTGVAEPYFVTDGMNLVKEEVKELPYYATLNVRSEQDTLMTFVADKIPEGYRVSLIDGEQTIEMNEGSRYETNISAGENADRFKLLIQNNVGLNQISQADITIANSNRHVAISAEAISNVEVFNALGQRVYQTKASTFTLSGVQSGVYVVRVSTAKGTKSQKIVVE